MALAVALTSLLTGRPVRHDVAITGEITLRGLVLPVGGIKEKVLAAHRAGIQTVFMPERNRKDMVDIPEEVLRELDIRYMTRIDDALDIALEGRPAHAPVEVVPPPPPPGPLRPEAPPTAPH